MSSKKYKELSKTERAFIAGMAAGMFGSSTGLNLMDDEWDRLLAVAQEVGLEDGLEDFENVYSSWHEADKKIHETI